MPEPLRSVAIFDLGRVLIDWNPRYLYRKLFAGDDAAMEWFLAEVCSMSWIEAQDEGRSYAEGTAVLKAAHPRLAPMIDAFIERWEEMMAGPIDGTVEILAELKARRTRLYALTNWSAETFPLGRRRFPFLEWFQGIVVSGEERVSKPDPRIFRILFDRYFVAPAQSVFIDDNPRNVAAATALGLHGITFTEPALLRRELTTLGML